MAAFTCGLVAVVAASSQVAAFPGAAVSQARSVFDGAATAFLRIDADAKAGRKRIIDGVKAFEKNQYDKAIDRFSAALRSGGLSSQDIAKAMFFRGQAYEKSNKPAEAIADLTSAIWLKDGLSEAERKTAETLRAKAYQSAGIAAAPPSTSSTPTARPAPVVVQAPAQALAKPATVARAAPIPSAPQPAFTTRVAKAPSTTSSSAPAPRTPAASVPAFTTRTTQAPTRAGQAPVRPADVPRRAIQPFSTQVATTPRPPSAQKPAAPAGAFTTQVKPAPSVPTRTASATQAPASAGSGTSGSGFFGALGSLFSGGLSGGSSAPVSTASTASTVAGQAATQATSGVSSWSTQQARASGGAPLTAPRQPVERSAPLPPASQPAPRIAASTATAPALPPVTVVTPATPPAKPLVTAALSPDVAPPSATEPQGRPITEPLTEDKAPRGVIVQVAAVRSRAEAERVALRLVRNHSSDLGSRRPRIAEATYGSMGTFYNVQLGPFDGEGATGDLCRSLRNSGYDCLITTR